MASRPSWAGLTCSQMSAWRGQGGPDRIDHDQFGAVLPWPAGSASAAPGLVSRSFLPQTRMQRAALQLRDGHGSVGDGMGEYRAPRSRPSRCRWCWANRTRSSAGWRSPRGRPSRRPSPAASRRTGRRLLFVVTRKRAATRSRASSQDASRKSPRCIADQRGFAAAQENRRYRRRPAASGRPTGCPRAAVISRRAAMSRSFCTSTSTGQQEEHKRQTVWACMGDSLRSALLSARPSHNNCGSAQSGWHGCGSSTRPPPATGSASGAATVQSSPVSRSMILSRPLPAKGPLILPPSHSASAAASSDQEKGSDRRNWAPACPGHPVHFLQMAQGTGHLVDQVQRGQRRRAAGAEGQGQGIGDDELHPVAVPCRRQGQDALAEDIAFQLQGHGHRPALSSAPGPPG